jgi:fermentation-respiration switch protein FrsA (DUF1100 family)
LTIGRTVHRLAIVAMAAPLGGCGIPVPGPFYSTPLPAAQPNGSLISAQPYPAPPFATAFRVLYVSTDIDGRKIPVSGVIYLPKTPAPAGGRDIVAWAHPTTGIAPGCAPSLDRHNLMGLSLPESIPGLRRFIKAGDIVTATDYPGLGTPSMHPYLVGVSEGRSIIDLVRAARHLPGADAGRRYAVWGHSQGGQAALFAGQIASAYAPSLSLMGVAAAAPPTDLGPELTSRHASKLLTAYVYRSWSAVYHVPITSIVAPQAVRATDHAASKCINSVGQYIVAGRAASALAKGYLAWPPQATPPWPALFTENSPGHAPPGAPLLIVQGTADTTVKPKYTQAFVAKLCRRHAVLDYVETPGAGHVFIGYKSAKLVAGWIASRFAGAVAPDTCSEG